MLDQFEFKNRIAETLIRTHVKEIPEVADEAELEVENGESVAVPKRTKVTAIPPNEVRFGYAWALSRACAPEVSNEVPQPRLQRKNPHQMHKM
ncbi:hypothetical protein HPB48_023360 [Haemaphysalis longicornis]|uniref:Uncharacterized protein n=1 Tax=Haemaphysalis longicornis TaxID=44386 RepID=A0A9J6H515_HAELO|nr:hypothetical protein HPB48_023360 [Haemaphysalis longicornis]